MTKTAVPEERIGFDRFSLALLTKKYSKERTARLAMLAHGNGPFAVLAGQMLSDAVNGGITGMDGRVVGVSSQLDTRTFWVNGYVAVQNMDEMPESTWSSMIGRDAWKIFGLEELRGRKVVDMANRDSDTWWVKLNSDVVMIDKPDLLSLMSERARLLPLLLRIMLRNSVSGPMRKIATILTLISIAMVGYVIITADQMPAWQKIVIGVGGALLTFKQLNGRDWDAQKRVEKRAKAIESLAR